MTVTTTSALSRPFSTTASGQRAASQSPNLRGDPADSTSYILTLLTNTAHLECMTSLRKTYFPPKLNKIPAHITLFHALPISKLESEVLPAIREIASRTPHYQIRATHPFALGKGVGIAVADDIEHSKNGKHGRNMTRIIHAELRKRWGEWLSEQDSAPIRMHYTVMNKIDDEKVKKSALQQLTESFKRGEDVSGGNFYHGDRTDPSKVVRQDSKHHKLELNGEVQGFILYTYERSGHWKDPQYFKFEGKE